MLILTRKKEESIVINENIEVSILEIKDGKVKIGIEAPKNVAIHRKEVFLSIEEENKLAKETKGINLDILKDLMKK